MKPDMDALPRGADDSVREIPKWARRYAQNRTLPMVAMIVIFTAACCVFGGLGLLTGWAIVKDKPVVLAACMLVLCGFTVWWLWFSLIGVLRIMRSIAERLYQGEGGVWVGACAGIEKSKGLLLVAIVFMFCVHANLGLGLLGFLPIRYMQPISALYVVPFLCYLALKVRRIGSPFMFLWPALYGLHAVLLVAGVPIRMGPVLDMAVPTVGYGLATALAGHIYSRVALRRLRRLAASPEL